MDLVCFIFNFIVGFKKSNLKKKNLKVKDWDAMEKVWEHAFLTKLRINMTEVIFLLFLFF